MKSKHLLLMLLVLLAPWAAQAQQPKTLTVYDSNCGTCSPQTPVNAQYQMQKCQFIIPADQLVDMEQQTITKMTFRASAQDFHFQGFEVYLMEVDATSLSTFYDVDQEPDASLVYSGDLDVEASTSNMDVVFTNPYHYNGGNLLVSFWKNHSEGSTQEWTMCFCCTHVEAGTCVHGYAQDTQTFDDIQASQLLWVPTITFTYTETLTAYENASYWNSSVPVRGYSANAYQKSQFIIPDELLLDASDCYLNGMSFYMDTPAFAAWTGTFRVELMDTGIGTSFENNSFFNVDQLGDRVYTGTLDATGSTMNIVFDHPYRYNGGNLLVSVYGSPGLNSWNAYFVGATIPNASLSNYNSTSLSSITTGTIQNFAPKVTFQYISDFIYPRPAFLEASNITGDGATLTWEGNPSYTYMLAYYKASGGSWTTRTVTGTSCTLSSLEPNTTYIVKVRRVVNGEYGSWKGTNFTTNAEPVPDGLMLGFSDWDLINGSSTNAWVHDVGTPIGAGWALGISNDGGTNAYTVTETSTVYAAKLYWFEDAQYQFTIYWKGQGERNYDYMRAALVPASVTLTAGTSPSGFSYNSLPMGWIALDGGNQLCMSTADSTYFGEATVSQVDVTAGNYYMVFSWHNDAFDGTQPPASVTALHIKRETCPVPTNLAVTDITGSSATLSWNAYEGQNHWDVFYKTDDESSYQWSFETDDNPCVFAGHPDRPLQPQTHYTVSVQAFCGDEHTDWSDEIDFTTGCASFGLPYTYGFEDESDMDCWSMVDCHSSTGRTSYAYHEGGRSFRFYYSSNPPQYLISPKFEGTSAMEVSFYYRNQSNSYPETFQVGYSTTTNNPSAFTWGDEVTANDKDTWMLHEDIFPVGTKYVAVKYTSDDQYCLFLDDFSFTDAGACPKPKVTLDEVTPTSVTFSWENAEWCHLYLYQGTTLVHNTLTRINPYTIEGLTLGIDYRLEVMASCEQGISNPTIVNFTTPDFAPDGWIAFQDWTLLNGSCTNAWAYSNNSIYSPFISNDGGTTNAYSTGEASMVYATKLYAFEDAQYHFVTCWKGQGERNYDYLRIALVPATETLTPGTVPSGFSYNSLPEGWIALDGGNQLCLSTADDDMYGERAEVNIDVAAGNYYVVFAWRNDYGGGTQPPASITSMYIGREACATPTALAVTDITSSSATISWKVYEGQNAWEILYKTDDNPDYLWGVETNENPYVFEGYPSHPLQPGTHYTVKIRALCGDDEVGYWSDEIDFFTDVCEAEDKCEITFELTDSYGDGWNGAYIEVVDAATGVVVGTVTNENLNGTTGSGTNEVNIKTLAVCDGRELQFVWHSGIYDSECSYTIYGADAYPYITGSGAMSETASFTVDCSMSGCRKPTDVTILSTAPNDAVVGWTENGTSESWYVFYSTEEGSFNNYFEVYENPVYLSYYYDEELEPATTYYLFVTPSCAVQYDDPINSYSSDEVVFTTMEACPVPFNLSAEPIGGGAKLRWTGYSDSYNVRYRQVGETGWTTTTSGYWLELNYLESVTTYEFQVQGICDGATTDWSETATFTTKMLRQTVDDGDWNVATNWDPVGVPSIEEDVVVSHTMTIPAGEVAEANKIEGAWGALIIEDGGQLVHNSNGSNPPTIYMEKNITGYGSGNGHWYLITNPSSWSSLNPESCDLTSGNYDLYKFDYKGSDKKEWRNYKTATFSLDTYNSGYLYAHGTNILLELPINNYRPSNDRRSKYLSYTTGDYEFPGWYLIGNPFLCNAYLVNSSGAALPCYRMNTAGTDLEAVTSGAIAPLEGVFHKVTSSDYVYFTREAPARGSSLIIVVSGISSVDNAIISFSESTGLEKFNFREGGSKLYISQGGKDYAVAKAESNSGEMPVSFKAEQDGTYTLSFSSEEVTFSYLHLIDNITGEDIDLLTLTPEAVIAGEDQLSPMPSYTFNAKTTDNANRFKVVFITSNSK